VIPSTEKSYLAAVVAGIEIDKVRAEYDRVDPRINLSFASDYLAPAQFYDLTRRRASVDGETRLVFAILEDAVRCYLRNLNAPGRYRRALFDEVAQWFDTATGPQHPFSFGYVCDVLDIDPQILLRNIHGLKAEDLPTRQIRSIGRRHLVRACRRGNRGESR
jgi:hypothetical protein